METPPRPQSLAGIKDGVLHVQVDLLQPNADIKAHGFLGKAAFLIEEFWAEEVLRKSFEAKGVAEAEKKKIDLALGG